MTNRHIVDRALPDRTKLMFYFPVPAMGADYYVVALPFFENVVISEKKKARYQKYSLVSRSSNLYSYLGADSRNLNLSFNITLPHILEEHPEVNLDSYIQYDVDKSNVEMEKSKFLNPNKDDPTPKGMAFQLGTKYTQDLARDSARQVLNTLEVATSGAFNSEDKFYFANRYNLGPELSNELLMEHIASNPGSGLVKNIKQFGQKWKKETIEYNEDMQLKHTIIDIIIYWTNIIRASVVNYAKNPIYGPPIIRLRHGILYQDIPCICTNYSIDYNEAAGYDIDTLLPRQLKINMKLEEIRTGDFGEFNSEDANNIIKRDNLAGWEAVVLGDSRSMDPGYGGAF